MQYKPTQKQLDAFFEVYKEFYIEKKLNLESIETFYRPEMQKRNELGNLYLSRIWADEGIEVYHLYTIETEGRVRLTCSAAPFRNMSSDLKNKNGRLNRLLHWKDIQYFKEHGFNIYDLGGINIAENINVSSYKSSFSKIYEWTYSGIWGMKNERMKVLIKYDASIYQYRDMAYNLVNVLSQKYIVYIDKTDVEVDRIIDLGKITQEHFGVDITKYYYTRDRKGELTIGTNVSEKRNKIRNYINYDIADISFENHDICKQLNKLDICIMEVCREIDIWSVMLAMATGTWVIAICEEIKIDEINEYKNGICIKKVNICKLREAIDWCLNNKEYIRKRQPMIAKEIFENKRWEDKWEDLIGQSII